MKKNALLIIFLLVVSLSNYAFAQSVQTIGILAPWPENHDVITVVIINKAGLEYDKIEAVKKVIESEKSHTENEQTYFEGWTGALLASGDAKKFEISVSEKTIGKDIIVELLSYSNPNYNGYTVPHYDANHMVLASIEVFDSQNLSTTQLENIIRHEVGHALGLGHATDPDCIMYDTIRSDPKLITTCDLTGLKALENGLTFRSVESV